MRALGLLALLSLTACSYGPGRSAFEAGGLDGQWRIVSLNARPVDGSIRLERGQMTVSFGCNTGSGAFRIGGGQLVPANGLAVTERACGRTDSSARDPMALEAEGFRVVARPMWIAGTRENRRLRLWNEN
ncbi:MAG TPA: META domain-containing protein, partial [Sphingomicrobium sp.]|nr:META domain-containing protein [Sphingomicrobium sp.]